MLYREGTSSSEWREDFKVRMQRGELREHEGNFNLLVCEAQAQGQFDTLKEPALRGSRLRTTSYAAECVYMCGVLQEGCAGGLFSSNQCLDTGWWICISHC